jgi:hypothetical protein
LLLFYHNILELNTALILFAITSLLYAVTKILKKTTFRDYASNVEK